MNMSAGIDGKIRTRRAWVALIGAALTVPGAVIAQQGPVALEEVVVTARIWEESLQEVPASITALTAEQVERARLRSVKDIAALVPGMTFVSLQGSNFALPVIRGLSTNVGESNVGLFLDGVYQGSRSGMDRLLTDIERVEVARGPQVALYGRNTFGGAINVISKKPTNETEATLAASYGSSEMVEAQGTLSGPLVEDRLYYRLGVAHHQRDGFYDNALTGNPLDDRESQVYSGSLRWQPSADLAFDLRASFDRTRNGDNPGYFTLNNSQPPFNGRSQIFIGEVPKRTDGFAVTPGGFERDSTSLSLKGEWNVTDVLSFTSITSYVDMSSDFGADIDYGPTEISYQSQSNDLEEISQEFRLSREGDRVSWLAGIFFIHSEQRITDLDQANAVYENLLPASLRSTYIDNREETDNYAVFGSLDWNLAQDWTATLAGRVFYERKSIDPFQQNPYTGVVLDPNPPMSMSDTYFTPSLALRWAFVPGMMAYGSITRGIKAGGFNALANVTASERTFDSESSWNYELGAKTSWLDGRAKVNLALFHIDWEDQIVRALGVNNATLNANAGATTSRGAEIEAQVRPWRDLQLSASYAYTDAKFDEYVFEALALSFGLESNLAGNQLQYVSRHVGTMSADYRISASANAEFFVRGDLSYRSRQYGSTTNLFYVGDITQLNAVAGVELGRYAIELWGRNLLDDETPTVSISARDRGSLILPPPGQGAFKTLAFAPETRSYGVTIRARF